jgi:hypothetical protein
VQSPGLAHSETTAVPSSRAHACCVPGGPTSLGYSLVLRMGPLPYADPASLAFVDEVERDASLPRVTSGPFGDSTHETRSDRLAGGISDRLGPEYAWLVARTP